MGIRFRKTINLGNGFKLNFSKSGIGGSWGTKGLRVTRTAKGSTRVTVSIPGTGISYVKEVKSKKRHYKIAPRKATNSYEEPVIVDEELDQIKED